MNEDYIISKPITYPKHNCKLYKFKVESPLFDYSMKFETCEVSFSVSYYKGT